MLVIDVVVVVVIGWLVDCLTSLQLVRVSQERVLLDFHACCAATLRQKSEIRLAISSSHSILTPGEPVPALTL